MEHDTLFGLVAEFDSEDKLRDAAKRAHAAGYRHLDAYSPFRIDGLGESVGVAHKGMVPWFGLAGGLAAALGIFALQYYGAVIDYAVNIGGRPLNSWPAFLVSVIVIGGLGAAVLGFIGFMLACGFPQPYHPLFRVPQFKRATVDRFFICLQASDALFERDTTHHFLETLDPISIAAVDK